MNEASGREPTPPATGQPQPRLGATWREVALEGGKYLEVAAISRNFPAERAGLKVGDRLLDVDGKDVNDDKHIRLMVMAAASAITLRVARPGVEEPLSLPIQLTGQPVRVGINWREDDAEPGVVILTGVVPGSAAAVAGLAAKDRLLEVNGERFTNANHLASLIDKSPSPLQLMLERRGKLYSAELELAP